MCVYICIYIYIYMPCGAATGWAPESTLLQEVQGGQRQQMYRCEWVRASTIWWCLTELIYEQCLCDACDLSRSIVRRLSCVSAAGKKSIAIHSTRRAAVRCWGPGTVGESPSGKTMRTKRNGGS